MIGPAPEIDPSQAISLPPALSVKITQPDVDVMEREKPIARVRYFPLRGPRLVVLGRDWKRPAEVASLMAALVFVGNLMSLHPESCPSSLLVARQRDDGKFDLWKVRA